MNPNSQFQVTLRNPYYESLLRSSTMDKIIDLNNNILSPLTYAASSLEWRNAFFGIPPSLMRESECESHTVVLGLDLALFVLLLTFGIYVQALSLDRERERLSSGMWDELIRQHSTSPTSLTPASSQPRRRCWC